MARTLDDIEAEYQEKLREYEELVDEYRIAAGNYSMRWNLTYRMC